MAKKKKAAKKRKKKTVARKPRRVKISRTVVSIGSRRKKGSSGITKLKARVRKDANERLKDGLFLRDQATTHKQHKAAVKKIDGARKDLRRFK
jgi:hypothetical protein